MSWRATEADAIVFLIRPVVRVGPCPLVTEMNDFCI